MFNIIKSKKLLRVNFCLWFLTLIFCTAFAAESSSPEDYPLNNIILPQKTSGIEKIEYVIDNNSQGSTSGKTSVDIASGSNLKFLVKLESQGYSKLYAKNVKLISDKGYSRNLEVYEYDGVGNLVTRAVGENELIDPNQTYVTESYMVYGQDAFHIEGVKLDTFDAHIKLENSDYSVNEALKVTFQEANGVVRNAEYNGSENSYVVKNVNFNQSLKVWVKTQDAYSQSNITFLNGTSPITITESDNSLTVACVTSDIDVVVQNVAKNIYALSFSKYEDATFKYKKDNSQDDFTIASVGSLNITHGESYSFVCETSGKDILEQKEITANGLTLQSKDGIYSLPNITENINISIMSNIDSFYGVKFPNMETTGAGIKNDEGMILQQTKVKYGESFSFEVVSSEGYTQNIDLALVYAVPDSKFIDGNYNDAENSVDAQSYILTPSTSGVFTVSNVKEPMSILIKNLKLNTYTVTLPRSVIGASYSVEETDNVKKLSDNKYSVVYGNLMKVYLNSEEGKSVDKANLLSENENVKITKNENIYTIENIVSDIDIIINNITPKEYAINFSGEGFLCRNQFGDVYENKRASIVHESGIIKFKAEPLTDYEIKDEGISAVLRGSNAHLELPESEDDYFTISNVTHDLTVDVSGFMHRNVNVTLISYDDSFKFKSPLNNEVLSQDNSVKYGSDFQFQLTSSNENDISKVVLILNDNEEIYPISGSSNKYLLESVSQDIVVNVYEKTYVQPLLQSAPILRATEATSDQGWNFIKNVKFVSSPKDSSTMKLGRYYLSSDATTIPNDYPAESGSVEFNFENYDTLQAPKSRFKFTSEQLYITPKSPCSEDTFNSFKIYRDKDYTKELKLGNGVTSVSNYLKINDEMIVVHASVVSECLPMDSSVDDGTFRVSCNIEISLSYPDISDRSDTDTIFENLYIVPQYRKLKNCKAEFNTPINMKYFNGKEMVDSNGESIVKLDKEIKNMTQNIKAADNSNAKICFIVVADEGYDLVDDCVRIYFEGVAVKENLSKIITLEQVDKPIIGLPPGKVAKCYRITKPYVENVNVSVQPACKKSYDSNFSGGGSIYFGDNENPFLYKKTEKGGDLTFSIRASEGYNEEVTSVDILIDVWNVTLWNPNRPEFGHNPRVNDYFTLPGNNTENSEEGNFKEINSSDFKIGEFENLFDKVTIRHDSNGELSFTFTNVKGNFNINTDRTRKVYKMNFEVPFLCGTNSTVEYHVLSPTDKIINGNSSDEDKYIELQHQENISFTVNSVKGFDISNIVVTVDHNVIDLINGKYIIKNVVGNKIIRVENIATVKNTVSFTQYEGVVFKRMLDESNELNEQLSEKTEVDYNTTILFKLNLTDVYSGSRDNIKVHVEYSSGDNDGVDNDGVDNDGGKEFIKIKQKDEATSDMNEGITPFYDCSTGIYKINIKENVRIYITGLEFNKYEITLVKHEGIQYYDRYGMDEITSSGLKGTSGNISDDNEIKVYVSYGEDFSFKIVPKDGYDVSNIKVYDQDGNIGSVQTQLLAVNDVYTIGNITQTHTIAVDSISKLVYNIEFRTLEGAKCIDQFGKEIDTKTPVTHGENYMFKISLDNSYDQSQPQVMIKGQNMPLIPVNGFYTIGGETGIKENLIVEILNVTKNFYTVTFRKTEGVIFKTSKNKPFTENQQIEYGGQLYFKVSLMDAYDKSVPWVSLSNDKTLSENAGIYTLNNVREDVEIIVKNVVKNPEEVTIDDVNSVPEEVNSESDVDDVIKATQTYLTLSEEQKAQVTNIDRLEEAQRTTGKLNHKDGNISINGVDWNIKLKVIPLSDDKDKMNEFAAKVERRSLLSLYEIYLVDLLTNTEYEVPYGQKVTVTIPCPDLTGYKNSVVAHEKSGGNMEYLDINMLDMIAQFETSSFSKFGVAAKKIPNYSVYPSDLKISVTGLVKDDDELKSLLGDGLVSKLGNLIDETDKGNFSSDLSNQVSNENSITQDSPDFGDSTSTTAPNGYYSEGSSKFTNMINLNKAYLWAIDNEFIAVILILVLGLLLIWLILYLAKRKNKNNKESESKK